MLITTKDINKNSEVHKHSEFKLIVSFVKFEPYWSWEDYKLYTKRTRFSWFKSSEKELNRVRPQMTYQEECISKEADMEQKL